MKACLKKSVLSLDLKTTRLLRISTGSEFRSVVYTWDYFRKQESYISKIKWNAETLKLKTAQKADRS